MEASGVKERIHDMWRWRTSRSLLIAAAAITVIISLFNLRLDAMGMLREVVSNFITCASITFTIATTMAVFGEPDTFRSRWRVPLLLLLLAFGGMAGGMIAWGINDLLFPYHVSHPFLYLLVVATLSIIFGVALTAYESVSLRLEATAERLAEKEVQEQTLLRLKTEAELEALRAKVDPHFLFNTLNSIASLIPESPEKAEDLVQRLSNLFHHALSRSDHEFVPLHEELEFIREYLEIERVRLGGRLDYAIDMDTALGEAMIPTMILQPLVENSVKYGVAPQKSGGRVDLRCVREADRCLITVADGGQGFENEDTRAGSGNDAGAGFGIAGVRQRLQLHYGDKHEFDIQSRNGVTVTIGIPITNGLPNRSG